MYNLFVQASKKKAKRRGFTLIELVIVIVILGVLAGVAALSFQNVTQSAKDGVAKSNLRAIKSACQVFQTDNNGLLPDAATKIEKYLDEELKKAWGNPTGAEYTYSLTPDKPNNKITIKVIGGGLPSPAGYFFEITGPVM